MTLSIDDAIALFVQKLRTAPAISAAYDDPNARHTTEGCDVRVADVLGEWWHREHRNKLPMPNPGEEDYAPFYDAAWELARRGILRPGPAFPALRNVMGGPRSTEADGFSLTEIGRQWISKYDQEVPFPVDPGRFATLLISYGNRFGPAFKQRITEANGCYRTLNYFAACAMAGGACESILLAVGTAKIGEKALRTYTGRDGRRLLIKEITANLSSSLKQPVETAASILSYWRDDAAHGYVTEITEFSAHDALSRLLRFAQFVDRNWDQLTANPPP
jgi:hypothetical protein